MGIQQLLLLSELLIALTMIGIILLQPSDGGGTGLGSDSGNSSMPSIRAKGTFLSRWTWILATLFIVIAILLTWMGRQQSGGGSGVLDGIIPNASVSEEQPAPSTDAFGGAVTSESDTAN